MGIKLSINSERLKKPLPEKVKGLDYTGMLATKMMESLRYLQKVIRLNDIFWIVNAVLWVANIGVLLYIINKKG